MVGILENGKDGSLAIERMIFHLVGIGGDNGPTILEGITPPEHEEFFLDGARQSFLQCQTVISAPKKVAS